MGSVETVGQGACNRCGATFGALATALFIAAARALAAPLATFAPAFTRLLFGAGFTASFCTSPRLATFAIAVCILSRSVLTRRGCVAARGSGHSRLVGQCQILLGRIARDALAAFSTLTAFSTLAALRSLAAPFTAATRLAFLAFLAFILAFGTRLDVG